MKSALEFLLEQYKVSSIEELDEILDTESAKNNRVHIISAMLKYGGQTIDRCAEIAVLKDTTPEIPYNNWIVDKESILKVKEELK